MEGLGAGGVIDDAEDEGENLTQDCGVGRPLDSPVQTEDEDGVQDDVQHRTAGGGGHGKLGAAVGADNPVHGVGQHIDGQGGQQNSKVLHGHADGGVRRAEQAEKGFLA